MGESAIAFTSDRGDRTAIWITGAMGGGATPLIENARDPAISPDQVRIAFTALSPGGYHIAVARLDNLQEVRTLTSSSDTATIAGNPAWSPDGRRICYVDRQDLWLVEASGGSPKRLLQARREKRVELFTSVAMLAELTDILARPKFERKIAASRLSLFTLAALYIVSGPREPVVLFALGRRGARPPRHARVPDEGHRHHHPREGQLP